MKNSNEIEKQISTLFESEMLAMLATQRNGQPYASLVAFWSTNDLKQLYFVTPKSTRKFANIQSESRVALLIDNSTNQDVDFHRAIAVTVVGSAQELAEPDRSEVLVHYLDKHPHLEDFARSPTTALVHVRVRSLYLVKNFQHVTELHLDR
jgi:nitroimidazol reductase NimA-like FMN-containing flavoprotein (pyridoxamine 5'-phosphate oxidase superfamily)